MAWRGVHISRPARLSYRDSQIVIGQDDGAVRLPLEDIAWLILDTKQVTVTGSLLSACADAGIAMIVPDARHHPSGVLLPFHAHHAQAHVAHQQIAMTAPLKKRLWQHIVRTKIDNQAIALTRSERGGASALRAMATHVKSGDPGNVEARAARFYWQNLFDDFRRGDDPDRRNALLNYGYAVLRAALARACVAHGLLPAFGLHHASKTNAFNLVDDLIEPFRPLVDTLVYKHATTMPPGDDLTLDDRRAMAEVLLGALKMGKENVSALAASEMTAASLVRAMQMGDAAALVLPGLPARNLPADDLELADCS